MDAPSGSWPLSAAATALLLDPRLKGDEILKLALKELVLRRAWSIRRRDDEGRRRSKKATLRVREGDHPVPALAPLPLADAALREAFGGEEDELREVVKRMTLRNPAVAKELRADALEDLRTRGLIEVRPARVLGVLGRTTATRTLSGDAWIGDARGREASLRTSIGRTAAELTPQIAALGGLVLVLDDDVRADLDDAIRRARAPDGGSGAGGGFVDGGEDDDVSPLDDISALDDVASLDLDGLDASFESSFDSAVDAGGGGDGGGGGGGDGGG